MEIVNKVWGSEHIYVNNDKYCGKVLNLLTGTRCSMHCHKKKLETFLVIEGRVLLELNELFYLLLPNQSIDIPVNSNHRFTGLLISKIIEFSTHHEDDDSYRVEESCIIPFTEFEELCKVYGG